MNKTPLIIGCFCLASMMANAEVLTPKQALGRASAQSPAKIISNDQNTQAARLLLTTYQDNLPSTYVFSKDNGYMVLAADDVAVPVLGYSDEGSIDPANLPDGLKYWLDFYGQEIAAARAQGLAPAKAASRANDYAAIAPQCKTMWNQDAPYNNLCPESSSGQRAVTGCVATAMAQMLKYHNYPEKGIGTHVNTHSSAASFDYGNTVFDWANMLNYYGSNATEAQQNAVATLMLACGVAVDMNYGVDSSGASSRDIPDGLINYFGLDKSLHYLLRDFIPYGEWENAVYENLKNVGPVLYSGFTKAMSGHSFICDGYDKNGYFHFNWGWGGMSDGYFLFTALDPSSQGIGGADGAFSLDQCIIVGNVKPVAGSTTYLQVYCNNPFKITQSSFNMGASVSVPIQPISGSPGTIRGTLGLLVTDASGNETYFAGPAFTDMSSSYYLCTAAGYSVTIKNLSSGTYTVTPAWKSSDYVVRPILTPFNALRSYKLVVNGTSCTLTANAYNASVEVTSMSLPTSVAYAGVPAKLQIDVKNTSQSEFYSEICAGLYKEGAKSGDKPAYAGATMLIDVEAGKTSTISYNSIFSSAPAGTYDLYFYDPTTYKFISGKFSLTLNAKPSDSETKVEATGFTTVGSVTPSSMVFEFNVKCLEGLWDGKMQVCIYQKGKNYSSANLPTNSFTLYAGEDETLAAVGSISRYTEGIEYEAYLLKGTKASSEKIAGPITIVFGESGIEGVEADNAAPVYYNLQGVRVDDLQPGHLYIKVQSGRAAKIRF